MNTTDGYDADIAWKRQRHKQHAPPTTQAQQSSPTVSPPSPAHVGEGTGINNRNSIDMRLVAVGASFTVISLVVVLLVLAVRSATTEAAAQPPALPAAMPTTTAGAQAIQDVEHLLSLKKFDAAAAMAEDAVRTAHPLPHERTRLQELVITATLHDLLAQPISLLNVTGQQQVITRIEHLKQEAADSTIPFPMDTLTLADKAAHSRKLLLSIHLYEAAYGTEFTSSDHDMLRRIANLYYEIGWWYSRGTGDIKQLGVRYLLTSHRLQEELNIAPGQPWAELLKHCHPDKDTCPDPIDTPFLTQLH